MGSSTNPSADGEDLILVSWFENSVRVWNPRTNILKAKFTDLALPVSAIAYEGNIVVSLHGRGQVVALEEDGDRVIASNLPAPTGLVAAAGKLYVSDREREFC